MDAVEIETTGTRIDEVTSLFLPGDDHPPTKALVREHVALVHACAVEFNSQGAPTDSDEPMLPQTGILINALFDRHFFPEYRGSPPVEPEPLVDFLLQVVDRDYSQDTPSTASNESGWNAIMLLCTPSSPELEMGDSSRLQQFILHFVANLKYIWDAQKARRLQWDFVSPMPWSAASRRLEVRRAAFDFAHAQPSVLYDQACQDMGIPKSSADFIHIPPMRWLGAAHDGHPASDYVPTYVWTRYQTGRSMLEHAALWQSALTFGVLEAITGLIIPESWLLSTRDDGTVLFTSHQAAALAYTFGARLYWEEDPVRRRLLTIQAYKTIEWAYNALSEALRFSTHPHHNRHSFFWSTGITDSEISDIVCSIHYLLVLFNGAIIQSVSHRDILSGNHKDIVERAHESYTRRMLEKGWCPYTVAKLKKSGSGLAVLLGILDMEKPAARRHPDEHAACNEERCTLNNVDPATYTTQHTTPTCSCSFIAPAFSSVEAMLSVQDIPVMTYDGNQLSTRRAADGPYVAISHIWADGLGSTTEKGLPTCQVSRIAAFARQLVPDGAFWIDGLCVPERRDLRKGAIGLMADTYRGAEKVIVLDSGLRVYCSSSRTPAENILRIKTSVWMQRVWTVHEAFLARELYFEFSDGLVAGREIRRSLEPHGLSGYLLWWWSLMTVFLDTSVLDPGPGEGARPGQRFMEVSRRIAFCTTSKPEDAPVAVAGMLGVKPFKILDESGVDARMRMLLLEVKTLSVDIMFRPWMAERLPFPGFTWAPGNITVVNWVADTGRGTAICTPEGLTTKEAFPVVLLSEKLRHSAATGSKGQLYVFDLLQDGRLMVVKPVERGPRPYDVFVAEDRNFNALVVRVGNVEGENPVGGIGEDWGASSVFPNVNRYVDVLAVHISDPTRLPGANSSDTAPVVCDYRFTAKLWNPPILQGSTPEGLVQILGSLTSLVCTSGEMFRTRITLR